MTVPALASPNSKEAVESSDLNMVKRSTELNDGMYQVDNSVVEELKPVGSSIFMGKNYVPPNNSIRSDHRSLGVNKA